jgi:hypothetical protein
VPLLGADLAQGRPGAGERFRRALCVSIAIIVAAVLAVSALSIAPLNWTAMGVKDPLSDLREWAPLRPILQERGLLQRPGSFIAGVRWHEAGRIDYALGGVAPVTCLCADARGYSVLMPPARVVGQDAVILLTADAAPRFLPMLETHFEDLQRSDDITLSLKGDVVAHFAVYIGHRLKDPLFR